MFRCFSFLKKATLFWLIISHRVCRVSIILYMALSRLLKDYIFSNSAALRNKRYVPKTKVRVCFNKNVEVNSNRKANGKFPLLEQQLGSSSAAADGVCTLFALHGAWFTCGSFSASKPLPDHIQALIMVNIRMQVGHYMPQSVLACQSC